MATCHAKPVSLNVDLTQGHCIRYFSKSFDKFFCFHLQSVEARNYQQCLLDWESARSSRTLDACVNIKPFWSASISLIGEPGKATQSRGSRLPKYMTALDDTAFQNSQGMFSRFEIVLCQVSGHHSSHLKDGYDPSQLFICSRHPH
jgi:hypothetical protein